MDQKKKSRIRMIGLDLDGTLLNENKELTEYTRTVLRRAIEKGVVVLAATGRPVTGVPEDLLEFPGMRYVIASNGGRIVDWQEKKTLYSCPVSYELAIKILKIFERYDTLKEIYYEGQGYVQTDELARVECYVRKRPMADYIRSTRIGVQSLWDKVHEMEGHGMDKVHAIFSDEEEMKEAEVQIRRLGDLAVTSALGHNLEVNAPGIDKGQGLLRLGRYLGISREEIMACGDGGNDLAMICAAGIGVAMANAADEVKAAADYITLSNEEDGAAKAIEKFVL